MGRKQFTFYGSIYESIRRIRNKAARADAYDAVCAYALEGIEPNLDSMADAAAIAFISCKPNLDASRRKAESGSKGGNSKQTASKPQANGKQTASEIEVEIEDEIEIEVENECYKETDKSVSASAGAKAQYKAVMDAYNRLCPDYHQCKSLSDNRRKAIQARFRSGRTLEDFETLFRKAQASSFLRGKNPRNWAASFDWLIKDSNMAKVLDGNYDDKAGSTSGPRELDAQELEAIQRMLGEG